MPAGSHATVDDPRNATVRVWLNGVLVPRDQAMVSILDSGFLMGDGLWESLRIHNGRAAFLDDHLARLFEGLAALHISLPIGRAGLRQALADTLAANGMVDGVHVRLMVTRGLKATPFQGRSANIGNPTVAILAEYKQPAPHLRTEGLKLFTVHVRRGRPDVQDPGLNTHSKHNCVLASIQADEAGADEALMLDPHGFVATCNSTHFFIVRDGALYTSSGRYCLEGITRGKVLELARANGIPAFETDFALRKVYGAEEAFCTGTFGGIIPVREVDGRSLQSPGPMTRQLQHLYDALIRADTA